MIVSSLKFAYPKGMKTEMPVKEASFFGFVSNPIKGGLSSDVFERTSAGKISFKGIEDKDIQAEDVSLKASVNEAKFDETIYNRPEEFANYFADRLKSELVKLDSKDIEAIIDEVALEQNVSKKLVASAVSQLTQFSSYKNLAIIGDKLTNDKISDIYHVSPSPEQRGLALNNAIRYAGVHREQLYRTQRQEREWLENYRTAYFIDEYALRHLSKMKEKNPKDFEHYVKRFKNGIDKFYLVDGWSVNLDGKYYSYGMFDKNIDLKTLTSGVIAKMKEEGTTLDDAINGDMLRYAKDLLGQDAQINILRNEGSKTSIEEIAKNVTPRLPNPDDVNKVIEICTKDEYKLLNPNSARAALREYLNVVSRIFSEDTMADELKAMHQKIIQKASELGYSEDDIVYLVPNLDKSFALVGYQYIKLNDIDPEKFILYKGNYKCPVDSKHKCFVILDDMAGSGLSIIKQRFHYEDFLDNNRKYGCSLIFAPLVSLGQASSYVENKIYEFGRDGEDFLICNHETDFFDFAREKANEQKLDLLVTMIDFGYDDAHSCVIFPYGAPDNNSGIGRLFSLLFTRSNVNSLRMADIPPSYAEHLNIDCEGREKNED